MALRMHLHLPEWWVDGMVDGFAAVADKVRAKRRYRLIPEAEGYRIDGQRARTRVGSLLSGGAGRAAAAGEADRLRGQHVDIVLRSDEVLVRVLDPLPAQSRPYLQDIVRHNLETLIPWRLTDVYYGFFVASAGVNAQQLVVTVVATARSMHAELLSRLRELRPKSLRLLYVDPAVPTRMLAIDTDDAGGDRARRARLARVVSTASTLAGLAVAAVATLLIVAHQSLESHLERLDAEIGEAQQALAAAGGVASGAASKIVERLVAHKRDSPVVVLALDALSAALPDDTRLTELRIAEGRVRITGISQNVGALIPLLDASRGFTDARFFAPTTRLPDGRSDQFHLEFQLLPRRDGQ
jgi:general secretion pathway protein L